MHLLIFLSLFLLRTCEHRNFFHSHSISLFPWTFSLNNLYTLTPPLYHSTISIRCYPFCDKRGKLLFYREVLSKSYHYHVCVSWCLYLPGIEYACQQNVNLRLRTSSFCSSFSVRLFYPVWQASQRHKSQQTIFLVYGLCGNHTTPKRTRNKNQL